MSLQQPLTKLIATLLVFPSVYFIGAAFLKFVIGLDAPWQLLEPFAAAPFHQNIGLNINLLVVFGPIASLIMSTLEVIKITIEKSSQGLKAVTMISFNIYYWLIIATSLVCMGCMFLYFISENCNCH